jgi:septal ring factor EnvC (AmiA/AmiB activator)
MLSSVLRSKIAIEVNINIMRTFTALRKYALTHDELAKKIEELEGRVEKGEQVDRQILDVLSHLISDDKKSGTKKIGFV